MLANNSSKLCSIIFCSHLFQRFFKIILYIFNLFIIRHPHLVALKVNAVAVPELCTSDRNAINHLYDGTCSKMILFRVWLLNAMENKINEWNHMLTERQELQIYEYNSIISPIVYSFSLYCSLSALFSFSLNIVKKMLFSIVSHACVCLHIIHNALHTWRMNCCFKFTFHYEICKWHSAAILLKEKKLGKKYWTKMQWACNSSRNSNSLHHQ